LRIVPPAGKIVEGEINYYQRSGQAIDLVQLDPRGPQIRAIRGAEISMVFQEPMTSLSPVHTIGNQIMEVIVLHQKISDTGAREKAIEMLKLVGMPRAESIMDRYPHQLSGGMRQRAMIAMALSCSPRLLIADEPTTALDVTTQAQILALMRRLQREMGMAIMFITHDLGVIAQMTEYVIVMYLGKVVEMADVDTLFYSPKHPYTHGLLHSIPKLGHRKAGARIAHWRPRPVRLHIADRLRIDPRNRERLDNRGRLPVHTGGEIADLIRPIVVNGRASDNRVDSVAIANRILQPTQDENASPRAEYRAFR
jgi:peptide/nickel transport system ATP-binding protein